MKTLKNTLPGFFIIVFVFCSCSDDPSATIPNSTLTDITQLEKDPLYSEYLEKRIKATNNIVNPKKAFELHKNIENLSDEEKDELAKALGYENLDAYHIYLDNILDIKTQLEKKYGISQQDENTLIEITLRSLQKFNMTFLVGDNTNPLKNQLLKRSDYPCFDYAIEADQQNVEDQCADCIKNYEECYTRAMVLGDKRMDSCILLESDQERYRQCMRSADLYFHEDLRMACFIEAACCIIHSCDCWDEETQKVCEGFLCC